MQSAVLIRLRPAGPWRFGPSGGATTRLDTLFRSDRLFSALTLAAAQLGFVDEWLDATARSQTPSLALSSLFPFQGDTLFVTPPAALWPPPPGLLTSPSPLFLTKVRWTAATFIPTGLAEGILTGQKLLADQWVPDPESGCLLRRDRPSTAPFRTVMRTGAAVDRISKTSFHPHTFAGVEFEPGAGLWTVVQFANEHAAASWRDRVKGLFRLLADTGFGGRRSSGWGQVEGLQFSEGPWPNLLFPKVGRALNRSDAASAAEELTQFWLLSVFSPEDGASVDWKGGNYSFVERQTRGKQRLRLVAEGSVLSAPTRPLGRAVDVAGERASRPVYRSGIAVVLQMPAWPEVEASDKAVVEPLPEEDTSPAPEPACAGPEPLEPEPIQEDFSSTQPEAETTEPEPSASAEELVAETAAAPEIAPTEESSAPEPESAAPEPISAPEPAPTEGNDDAL